MRQTKNPQMKLGEIPISEIKIPENSRDDIPPLLRGLQHIYVTSCIRKEVFAILETMVPKEVSSKTGRRGMELWKIFVLGVLRLNLNWDYDRLLEMANNHKTIRQMLGHDGFINNCYTYKLQTLKDNISLFTPEILEKINQVVVKAGHALVKKKEEKLKGRCDSFVVETDVHYPTDINLLLDAIRKIFDFVWKLSLSHDLPNWRQHNHNFRKIKKLFRKAQRAKPSTSKDSNKKEKQEKIVIEAYQAYIDIVASFVGRAEESIATLRKQSNPPGELETIDRFIVHANRQIDQIRRRVINKEIIPHNEKVFSIFEEHTEWICKGKAGVPVELGVRACILEDQYGFILHHRVMYNETDDKVAVLMVKETQEMFEDLTKCSFDKGFYTVSNKETLTNLLALCVLPKKGRLSKQDQTIEYSDEFVKARRQHSAVESAINALEVHGLDRCPDHGIEGFNRYVALAVTARNIQQLGVILLKKQRKSKVTNMTQVANLKKVA